MITTVILDVEGVLTRAGGSQIAWPLRQLLNLRDLLSTLPLNVVLCTGRQEPYGEAVIQALDLFYPFSGDATQNYTSAWAGPLSSWPSVFENGAYFYDPIAKRPIRNPSMPQAQLASLKRLASTVIPALVERTQCQCEAGKDYCVSINPPLIGRGGDRYSTDEFRPVVDATIDEFAEWIEVKHSASAIDITPRGVSKAAAVKYMIENTGLTPNNVLGVGDTGADQAWLDVVGTAAAPSTGAGKLSGLDYLAGRSEVDGLIDILEQLRKNDFCGLHDVA